MERDEILRRNKQSTKEDEGEQYIEMQSKRFGEIGLCSFFIVLILYKLFKGLPANDLLAIFWGYLGVGSVYKYRFLKTKKGFGLCCLWHHCGGFVCHFLRFTDMVTVWNMNYDSIIKFECGVQNENCHKVI